MEATTKGSNIVRFAQIARQRVLLLYMFDLNETEKPPLQAQSVLRFPQPTRPKIFYI